jgi:hypothetical protein
VHGLLQLGLTVGLEGPDGVLGPEDEVVVGKYEAITGATARRHSKIAIVSQMYFVFNVRCTVSGCCNSDNSLLIRFKRDRTAF